MNFRRSFSLIAFCIFAQGTRLFAQDAPGPGRNQQLQDAFLQFPLLSQATNSEGQPEFQKLAAMDPVVIEGTNYYGFRFTVPPRENAEDFVWAFIERPNLIGWYIVPETGTMDGFVEYCHVPRTTYVGTDELFPLGAKRLIVQGLSGDSLKDGQTYLIWWSARGNPRPVSLMFTFAALGPDRLNKIRPMEKVLGLVRAAKQ
jgi:hypothetical protein